MVEILGKSGDSIMTSESAKNWTEKSPNNKLKDINRILDNEKIENIKEIKSLKDKIKNREYRNFQKMIGVPNNRCDGKLGRESLDYFNNYVNELVKGNKEIISNTINKLSEFKLGIPQVENVTDTLNIQHNASMYLESHETMSESEYNRLFSGQEQLQQGQFGDCYLVSGMIELINAQHFRTLMRTSIQPVKRKDGSGSGYQIKIPLGEPSGRKILIKNSELNVAKIKGNTGYKILELVYAKNKLRKNDKQGNRYSPITPGEFAKIRGGLTHEVLQTFLGKQNISFNHFGYGRGGNKPLKDLSNVQKSQIIGFLKNYVPSIGNKTLSLGSLQGDDRKQYKVGKNTIYHGHAYSVKKVNKNEKGEIKSITILNPRNSKSGAGKQYQDLTIDEFFSAFSVMSCGKIKTKTFLDNK